MYTLIFIVVFIVILCCCLIDAYYTIDITLNPNKTVNVKLFRNPNHIYYNDVKLNYGLNIIGKVKIFNYGTNVIFENLSNETINIKIKWK
jgi:hypothetical protein